MIKRKNTFPTQESGFSLIELLVYLVILGILMTVVMRSFTVTLQRTSQQSSIGETKIETGIGLDLLRTDLEHAGFGLPWQFPAIPNPYIEPAPFADAPNIPRPLVSSDASALSVNASDYITIKGTNVIRGVTGQKWGYVGRNAAHGVDVQSMSGDSFVNTDRVIVIRPETSPGEYRQLIMDGTNYFTQPTTAALANYAPIATPNDPDGIRYLIYGLKEDANIRRPFNRTDYYINAANIPDHCAPNTGVLVKATLNQTNDNFAVNPIVDCVADFQIVYYLDTDGDGGWDQRSNANGLNGLTAEDIRDQVKEVRYYILTHEGTIDNSFTYSTPTISVGEVAADGVTLVSGQVFNLNVTIGGNWANYRWKVDSKAVTPINLK